MLHLEHNFKLIVLLATPGKALGYLEVSSTPKKQNVLCIMNGFYSYYTVRTNGQTGQTYGAILLYF